VHQVQHITVVFHNKNILFSWLFSNNLPVYVNRNTLDHNTKMLQIYKTNSADSDSPILHSGQTFAKSV